MSQPPPPAGPPEQQGPQQGQPQQGHPQQGYQQGPPPQGYYQQGPPPQGYYQQGPPPKKSHTLRNVLLIFLALFVLFIGGCMALIGGAANEVDKAMKEESSSDGSDSGMGEEEANDSPTIVKPGKPFTHDGFRAARGWKVGKEEFVGTADITGLTITNTTDEDQRVALLTFRFYNGKNVLGEVICDTNEMQAGETSRMNCSSLDEKFPRGYKTIKVADAF